MADQPPSGTGFLSWLRENARSISAGDAAIAIGILKDRMYLPEASSNAIPDGSRVVFMLRGETIHGVVAHTSAGGVASVEVRRHDGGLERVKVPVSRLRALTPENSSR